MQNASLLYVTIKQRQQYSSQEAGGALPDVPSIEAQIPVVLSSFYTP